MSSTVMRVPATTGLPIITFGSETISGAGMDDSSSKIISRSDARCQLLANRAVWLTWPAA
jgi:hypothetical protein